MMFTNRDWDDLLRANVDPALLADLTHLTEDEVNEHLAGAKERADRRSNQIVSQFHHEPPLKFLTRPDFLRSRWGCRIR